MEGAWRHTVGHAAGRRRGHREDVQHYTGMGERRGEGMGNARMVTWRHARMEIKGDTWAVHGDTRWGTRRTHWKTPEERAGLHRRVGGGLMGERMRDARKVTRPHARMDIGGEHMDGAWRNTAGWKLGGHMDGAWGHTVGHTAGHIGGHQKNAQKNTDGTHGGTHGGTNGGTHRRTHCGMPGWKFGGHMESACRHTVGARSLTHGRTPEERAAAHRWHARRDTRRDARKDAWRDTWKDARRHASDGNWGRTHGRRMETHGEAHGLTQNGGRQKNTQDYTEAWRDTWGGGAHGGRTEGWGTRQHTWRHARKHTDTHTHMAGTQARMHDSTKARCMPNFKFKFAIMFG